MRTFSGWFRQVVPWAKFPYGAKQETGGIVIIGTRYREVWLDRFREAHGDGQGSGLSGQVESRDAGLNPTPPAVAE